MKAAVGRCGSTWNGTTQKARLVQLSSYYIRLLVIPDDISQLHRSNVVTIIPVEREARIRDFRACLLFSYIQDVLEFN